MDAMALLAWGEENSVGVQAMDEQHKQLFAILNELHEAMMQGRAHRLTSTLLRKLADYTKTHFTAEEALLQRTRFPGLAAHRVQHLNLVRQVQELSRRQERGEITVNLHLLTFLRDWLMQHILQEDKAYGSWLNRHGVQ
jgi:hemerythrin-like metal-binding protein